LLPGDEILISHMEHHANIIPWQQVCAQTGAILRVIPINDRGELCFEEYRRLLNPRTKLLAIVHLSNTLGTINPLKDMIELAHQNGTPVLVDGAQAAAHLPIDVQALDCDFYAFSAHKMYGPTGVGVLYAKKHLLDAMPPYQVGGDMVLKVNFAQTTYQNAPYKFEAGTPAIASTIGLGAAIDYLSNLDLETMRAKENHLVEYARERLTQIPHLRIIGTAAKRAALVTFVFDDIHAHDVATVLDRYGVAVRAGHHCTMPLMARFLVPATVRASLALYNTAADIDALVSGLLETRKLLGN
jgi:cysteine desulfurase/selenocysteine lyase